MLRGDKGVALISPSAHVCEVYVVRRCQFVVLSLVQRWLLNIANFGGIEIDICFKSIC